MTCQARRDLIDKFRCNIAKKGGHVSVNVLGDREIESKRAITYTGRGERREEGRGCKGERVSRQSGE